MLCPHLGSTYQKPDKPRLIPEFLKRFSQEDHQVVIESEDFKALNHKERRSILEAVVIEGIMPSLIQEIKNIDFEEVESVSGMIKIIKECVEARLINFKNDLLNSDLDLIYKALESELLAIPIGEKISIHENPNTIIMSGLGTGIEASIRIFELIPNVLEDNNMMNTGFEEKVAIAKKSKKYALDLASTNLIFFSMVQSVLKYKDGALMHHKFTIKNGRVEINQSLITDWQIDVESSEHRARTGPSTTGCPAIYGGRGLSRLYDCLLEIYSEKFWKE